MSCRFKTPILYLLFSLCLLLGLNLSAVAQPLGLSKETPVYRLQNWQIHSGNLETPEPPPTVEDSAWQNIASTELDHTAYQMVWLRTELPNLDISGPYLYLRVFEQAFVVYIDKTPIYRFGEFPQNGQFKSPGSRWHTIALPQNSVGKKLMLGFYGRHQLMGFLKDHYIAQEKDIYLTITRTQLVPFILGIWIILLGLLTRFLYHHPSKHFAHTSLLLFSLTMGGIAISRSELKQLFWDAPVFWSWTAALSFHLMPLALLAFVRSLVPPTETRWLNIMLVIQSVFCLSSLSLAWLNMFSWLTSMRILILLLSLIVLVILKTILHPELRRQQEFKVFLGGFILFAILGMGGGILLAYGWLSPVHKPMVWGVFFFYLSLIYILRHQVKRLYAQQQLTEKTSRYKDLFLANMSHELRTPLNSIIGFSKVLLKNRREALNPKELNYLQRIHDNGAHLLQLVNNILDISKIEADKMELEITRFPLNILLRDIQTVIEPLLKENHNTFTLDNPFPEQLELQTDRQKLFQILLNLVSNATKFTQQGQIMLRLYRSEDWLCLSVIDTGIGIQAEALPHLFQHFSQVDKGLQHKAQGSGLGLAISQKLAHLMQGQLHVQSVWGQGSTFTLSLPLGTLVSTSIIQS